MSSENDDSQESTENDETESGEQESKHESSEHQSSEHETTPQEKVEDQKVEETPTDDTSNDMTQKIKNEVEETPVQKIEETHVHKVEENVQEKDHKEEEKVHKEEEKVHKEEAEEKAQVDVATEKVHKEEAEEKVQQVDVAPEKIQKEEVEEKVQQEKKVHKEEAEEKAQVDVVTEKVHKEEGEAQVDVATEKVHKEEAEEKAQVDVATEEKAQVDLVTEKVQEEPEKKETHQDNQPKAKQEEQKEIKEKEKRAKKGSSKEVKVILEKKGKKDTSTAVPPDPASPEKGKPKPKRLLEERPQQPMTARFSGVMMTARDSKEVPGTSREVTREERGEKELAGWEITQKKAFTHWINSYLMSRNLKIEELGNDFRSGVLLIRFLECLTGQPFEQKYHTNPKLRVHSLENSQLSLKYLKNIKVPDITIGPEEIVDGNIKMMLGFCWILLRHFGKQQMQRDRGDKNDNTSFEDSILNWVRDEIKDYNVDISSFKTSFNDGRALLALCHKFNPSCIDYDNTDLSNSHTNVENGLRLIEQQYNVPALLHVDDLTAGKESDKNIVLYLSLLHGAWRREMEKKKVTEVAEERVFTLQEKLTILEEESKALKEERSELEEKVESLKKKLTEESEEKVEMKETKEQESQRIASEKEELRKAKDKLDKEKSDLVNENEEILQRIRRQQKAREELEEAVKKEQAKFGIAMEFLRKNILEHLQEIDSWKVFLEKGRNFNKEPVKLLQEDELKNKSPEAQIEALNQAILEENKRLELILEEREKEKESEKKKKSPRSPRKSGEPPSPRSRPKSTHQRVTSTTVNIATTKNERKSEVIKRKT